MLRHLKNNGTKQATKKRSSSGKKIKSSRQALESMKPDAKLPQGYLSASQVTMYLRCAKQYEFRYIEGLTEPPGIALTEGICHHEAVEADNYSKYKTGEPLSSPEVLDVFSDGFRDKSKRIPENEWYVSGETIDTVITRGRIFIASYMEKFTRFLIPSDKPEKKFEVEIGGVPFLGYIDLPMEKRVLDYKVVSRAKSQGDADKDFQLGIYSLVEKKKTVEFLCFCKTKVPKIVRIESQRSLNDYRVTEAIIEGVAASIKKGCFPMCNPGDNFLCNAKYCGYYHRCIGSY